jgi:DNA-binding response OmpR family regulator
MPDWKVLIVDDEKDFVSTLAERLRMRGMRADEAASGEEALAMMTSEPPQVVVLDIMMPGMSGLEVLKRIKADYPQVEVILLTGLGTKKEGMDLGAVDCLVKPLQIEELIDKINKAVQKGARAAT